MQLSALRAAPRTRWTATLPILVTVALAAPARPAASPTVAELVKNGRILATGRIDFDRSHLNQATITILEVLRDRDPRHSLQAGQVLPAPLHPASRFELIPGASYLWVFKSSLEDRNWISLQHRDKALKLFDASPKPPKRRPGRTDRRKTGARANPAP